MPCLSLLAPAPTLLTRTSSSSTRSTADDTADNKNGHASIWCRLAQNRLDINASTRPTHLPRQLSELLDDALHHVRVVPQLLQHQMPHVQLEGRPDLGRPLLSARTNRPNPPTDRQAKRNRSQVSPPKTARKPSLPTSVVAQFRRAQRRIASLRETRRELRLRDRNIHTTRRFLTFYHPKKGDEGGSGANIRLGTARLSWRALTHERHS